jgi:hypothetical protein
VTIFMHSAIVFLPLISLVRNKKIVFKHTRNPWKVCNKEERVVDPVEVMEVCVTGVFFN